MLQAVHTRRWEARPSTPAAGNSVRGGHDVVNSGPMAVAWPLSNFLPLRVSGGYQALRFKSRVEVAGRQSRGRTRTLCVVMAGQRGGEEASVAGRASGSGSSATSEGLREELLVSSLVDEAPQIGRGVPMNLAAGVGVTAAVIMMAVLGFMAKPRDDGGGSVSDLIKRGQLRSDRGDGKALKYEDPFNNPLVGGKAGGENSFVRMCGKLFRLAPVTLTDEKRVSHQNRRIQAYRWKRPVVFLSEGEPVPAGVDPEEVRWIPANHPFATTTNYIDEDLAQQNVMQVRGVPSRLKAEHEALRKKMMEAASKEPEFKLPDSSVDQWSSPPSPGEDGIDESKGERGDRRQLDRRRSPTVSNGSPRLRNIDGSEVLDEPK